MMDDESGDDEKMGRQVDEEVNRDKTCEADRMNVEVDSKDEVTDI